MEVCVCVIRSCFKKVSDHSDEGSMGKRVLSPVWLLIKKRLSPPFSVKT